MNTKFHVSIIIAFAVSIIPFVLHSVIAENAEQIDIKSTNLYDNRIGLAMGWDPDGHNDWFLINDKMVQPRISTITININTDDEDPICGVTWMLKGYFSIMCDIPPPNKSELYYTVFNQPIKVLTPTDPRIASLSDANITGLENYLENTTESLNKETFKQRLNSTN
jgi:hypothetical protein